MSSFDGNGLVIDRLADIKTGMQDDLKDSFGSGIDLDERGPFGVLVGVMSERYAKLYELLEAVNDASYPDSSFGVYLDQLSAFNGVVRESATSSVVNLEFSRVDGSSGDVTIDATTQVFATGSTLLWETDVEATILDGEDTVSVQATANETGPSVALAGTLVNMVSTPGQVGSVTNPSDATVGREQESDAELKARRKEQIARPGTATESGIRSALNLLDSVRSAQVVLNDTDVEVDGQAPHSIAAYVSAETGSSYKQDSELVFSLPLTTGQSIAILLNGVAIAGSPVAFDTDNDTTLDNIATAIEAESDVNTATRNGSDKIDVDGGSGGEVVLALTVSGGGGPFAAVTQTFVGDNLNEVAQSLWDSKGGGIQTYGEIYGIAIDTEGAQHLQYFSTVDNIDIEVQYTLSVDATYDLSNTEAAFKKAAVDYGQNNLTPGVDVLSYKLLCAASDVGASGIRTLSCGIRVAGGGSFIDEVVIGPSELALVESNNVTFIYV
ncbi:MAG: hypothetical protein E2O82_03670 [Betaproteobacteria bacterium]|nr:MAG: hypothetical protein E2O82_03670 [Betaproteobacteria bacterium]